MLFLTVVKVLGITLLVIIGLLLLLLLLVLFVPIRYRITSRKNSEDGSFGAQAVFSWFLRILQLEVLYKDGLTKCARIFGIPVKRGRGETDRKDCKRRSKRSRKTKRSKETKHRSGGAQKGSDKESSEKPKLSEPYAEEENTSVKYEEMEFTIESYEDVTENCGTDSAGEQDSERGAKEKQSGTDSAGGQDSQRGAKEEAEQSFFEKIREFFGKLFEFFKKRREKLKALSGRLKRAGKKLDFYTGFLTDENNLEQLRNIKKETGNLLWHIRPRKFFCHLIFGTEEPDTTGTILAIIAMAYPFFGEGLTVEPHFQENILDFDLRTKGKITIFVVLLILFRIYFHKGFRKMMRDYKNREV